MFIGGHEFAFVSAIVVDRTSDGAVDLYNPASRHKRAGIDRLNAYGDKQFCRFEVKQAPACSGIYALTANRSLQYIGRCENLRIRFGKTQYGAVSPKNCYFNGQSTNCKMNAMVAEWASLGLEVELWFKAVLDELERNELEKFLIQSVRPPHNKQYVR